MTPTRLRSTLGLLIGVAVLALPTIAPAAPSARGLASGTVIAKVQFRDAAGTLQPLADVEVFLLAGPAGAMYACTNAKGKATFQNVPANEDLLSATGVGLSAENCANREFLNPDTGKKMFNVFYKQHHGVVEFDSFQVAPGETTTIRFKTKTPKNQKKVCGGMMVTRLGTSAGETINGTPGNDVINALAGNDTVNGMGGNDIICSGRGADKLYGGDDDDWLFGEGGKDRLYGEAGFDHLFGGPATDRCYTGEKLYSCEL